MGFHSAMATLEPQKHVIAGTVGTENILLVSRSLVLNSMQLTIVQKSDSGSLKNREILRPSYTRRLFEEF